MSAASRFAYLHSRVSVFAERLFDDQGLQALIDRPLAENTGLLQQAGLNRLSEAASFMPQTLEQSLITTLASEADTLVRGLTGAPRNLLLHWMRRFELINLKTIVRGKLTGRTPDAITADLVDVGELSALPVAELIYTENVAELLRRLESTQYADMARYARQAYEERGEVFGLESVLDRSFYVALSQRIDALDDESRRQLRPLTGRLLDRINLVWLLRYRFAYDLAPPHAYFLLAPPGMYLKSAELLALSQTSSLDEALQRLPSPLNDLLSDLPDVRAVESALDARLNRVATHILRRTTFNVARAFAFLLLREQQMMGVHIAIKGQQLQLDRDLQVDALGSRLQQTSTRR